MSSEDKTFLGLKAFTTTAWHLFFLINANIGVEVELEIVLMGSGGFHGKYFTELYCHQVHNFCEPHVYLVNFFCIGGYLLLSSKVNQEL